MKTTLLLAILWVPTLVAAQKLMTKAGQVTFEASVPSFEEVKATHNAVTAVLNADTGELASLALVKGFRFKIALMEEHFNENYIQSDRYPKATFKGKIENFNVAELTGVAKDFTIKGQMELHGKSNPVSAPAKIRKTESGVEILATFNVNASDFDIAIPSVVKSKVSNKVAVRCEFVVK